MNKCYAAVTWPSRSDTTQNGASHMRAAKLDEDSNDLWQLRTYIKGLDGSTTETVLHFYKPLKAGTLEIIRVNVGRDGSVEPLDFTPQEVGVSVKLDWKSGGEHEIEI